MSEKCNSCVSYVITGGKKGFARTFSLSWLKKTNLMSETKCVKQSDKNCLKNMCNRIKKKKDILFCNCAHTHTHTHTHTHDNTSCNRTERSSLSYFLCQNKLSSFSLWISYVTVQALWEGKCKMQEGGKLSAVKPFVIMKHRKSRNRRHDYDVSILKPENTNVIQISDSS